jgi:predicted nucleic acid-binding protein
VTFVDTNIPIDIATGDPAWANWARQAIASAHARGALVIDAIVYAEFAIGFAAQPDCDAEIEKFDLTLAEIPKSAAFRAAQAFRSYRRAGEARTAVLPDLFIGAHASLAAAPLLARDARRYRPYFPELTLLALEGQWARLAAPRMSQAENAVHHKARHACTEARQPPRPSCNLGALSGEKSLVPLIVRSVIGGSAQANLLSISKTSKSLADRFSNSLVRRLRG